MFLCVVFFFKQKTAYEMRISDWSSDVCSSDLGQWCERVHLRAAGVEGQGRLPLRPHRGAGEAAVGARYLAGDLDAADRAGPWRLEIGRESGRDRVCQYV